MMLSESSAILPSETVELDRSLREMAGACDSRGDLPNPRPQDQALSARYYHTHLRTIHASPLLLTRHRQFSHQLHFVSTPHFTRPRPYFSTPKFHPQPAHPAPTPPEMALNVLLEYLSSIECLSILIGAIHVLQICLPS